MGDGIRYRGIDSAAAQRIALAAHYASRVEEGVSSCSVRPGVGARRTPQLCSCNGTGKRVELVDLNGVQDCVARLGAVSLPRVTSLGRFARGGIVGALCGFTAQTRTPAEAAQFSCPLETRVLLKSIGVVPSDARSNLSDHSSRCWSVVNWS
jgi:hypothetical protein